jgi:hypothetical protein
MCEEFCYFQNTGMALKNENDLNEPLSELTLEADFDVHPSEDEDIPQNNHNTDSGKDDVTGTNNLQWTDSTHCQPSVPVVHKFTVNPSC